MKRKIIVIIIALALAVAAFFFFFKTRDTVKAALISSVPEQGPISSVVTATGTIQPVDTVAVGTQVSGIISTIYTDYNAEVKEGQLLAELDPTLMQASVDQIKASLTQAKSNFTYQTANFERQSELFKVGAISKATYDAALNEYEVAKSSIASIEAQLRAAQQNLEFTKIYSPINGVVLNRSVSVGQTVAASFNTPTLFSLAKDITKMQVQAKVDEADIGGITAGQRVTFTVDAFVNDVFEGKVSEVRLQPTTSSNVVTYTTIIEANNDDMKLKPGMTATVTIFTQEAEDALLIPVAALKFIPDPQVLGADFQVVPPEKPMGDQPPLDTLELDSTISTQGERVVVWVAKGNQVIGKPVLLGINDNTQVQVLEGLTPTDSVISGVNVGGTVVSTETEAGGSPFMPQRPGRRR